MKQVPLEEKFRSYNLPFGTLVRIGGGGGIGDVKFASVGASHVWFILRNDTVE